MNSAANVAALKRLLDQTDERASLAARLRPLMPFIQSCVDAGLPYVALLDDLAHAGLPIKARLLERSLYRWRKARCSEGKQPTSITTPPSGSPDRAVVHQPPSTPHTSNDDAIPGRPRRIETPADLRQIRDIHIDLDALRREGEALRKAKQRAERITPQSSNPSNQESFT